MTIKDIVFLDNFISIFFIRNLSQ